MWYILNTESMNASHDDCIQLCNKSITSKQIQHKFQSVRRSRSDVETDNADRIKQ